MSFDSFRADLVSRLFPKLPGEQLQAVLSVMDEMAATWEFSPHTTAIITAGGLPDAVRLYIASKSVENVTKNTLQNYLLTLRAFFSAVRHPVDEITSADIRLWLNWYKTQHNVKNVTLEQKRVMLNSFFTWCVDEDLIRRNPVRQIKPIRCRMCLHLAAGLPFSSIPTVPRYTVRPSSQVISILALFTSMPTSCLHHSCFQSPFPIMYSSSR